MYMTSSNLSVISNKNPYFYLLTSDRGGKARLLYNDRGVQVTDLSPETEYALSLEAHVLRLDEYSPAEVIYILGIRVRAAGNGTGHMGGRKA